MIYDNFPWLKNRELRIIEIISETLIFIFFITNNSKFDIQFFIYSIPIIFFWICINYIFGRYVSIDNFKKTSLLNNLIYCSVSIIFIFLFYFSISQFNISKSEFFNNKNLINFLIEFAFITYLAHTLYLLIFYRLVSSRKHFVLACSKELSENIQNIFTHSIKLFKFRFTTIEDIDYENIEKYRNIIYENKNFLDKLNYYKNSKNNLKNINYIKWIEQNFYLFPFQLLDKKETLYILSKISTIGIQFMVKRLGDILCSIIILFFSSPLILLAAFLIYNEDKGPIIYTQIRTGQFEKNIKIYKLRTMQINAEKFGAQWAKKIDNRITNVGNILRKFRIDELPQLWNVIKGDMSLIGPRPERPEFDKELKEKIPNYNLRFKLKPGLSGWAQVNYPYGASQKDSSNKLSYDLFYMKNFSLFLDFLILFKTIHLVINAKGGTPNE